MDPEYSFRCMEFLQGFKLRPGGMGSCHYLIIYEGHSANLLVKVIHAHGRKPKFFPRLLYETIANNVSYSFILVYVISVKVSIFDF